ncbi:MAG TPA: response regulator [Gammaproteobacteria bacterium]|nr:response regulator [Gammaproteobacteria bacterium]
MTRRILIVDGSRAVRKMLQLTLRNENFEVTIAASSNQALAKLGRQHYDLVCTSMMLPDESGIAFIAAARRRPGYRFTPILLVTGNDINATELEPELGITGIIQKSEGIPALASHLRIALDK